MTYRIDIVPTAFKALSEISDRRIQEKIRDRIDGLAHHPEQQGKWLGGELAGFRSIRAVGQRYRIIYRTEKHRVIVIILAIGVRKEGDKIDIYALAKNLFRLHMLTD